MKKIIAFLLAVAMVAVLIPWEDADARGGRRRGGGRIGNQPRNRGYKKRDRNAVETQRKLSYWNTSINRDADRDRGF